MCMAPGKDSSQKSIAGRKNASDIPLGDGLADAAKLSLLSRRERIRRAVEGE